MHLWWPQPKICRVFKSWVYWSTFVSHKPESCLFSLLFYLFQNPDWHDRDSKTSLWVFMLALFHLTIDCRKIYFLWHTAEVGSTRMKKNRYLNIFVTIIAPTSLASSKTHKLISLPFPVFCFTSCFVYVLFPIQMVLCLWYLSQVSILSVGYLLNHDAKDFSSLRLLKENWTELPCWRPYVRDLRKPLNLLFV